MVDQFPSNSDFLNIGFTILITGVILLLEIFRRRKESNNFKIIIYENVNNISEVIDAITTKGTGITSGDDTKPDLIITYLGIRHDVLKTTRDNMNLNLSLLNSKNNEYRKNIEEISKYVDWILLDYFDVLNNNMFREQRDAHIELLGKKDDFKNNFCVVKSHTPNIK